VVGADQDCVDNARECVRLAGLAKDQETRRYLFDLAREWMAIAMHENRIPDAKAPPPH